MAAEEHENKHRTLLRMGTLRGALYHCPDHTLAVAFQGRLLMPPCILEGVAPISKML